MISADYQISRQEFADREELKRFYNTPVGIKELCQEIYDGRLLGQISTDDEILKHNLCVRRLERMGLLDQEGLEALVKWMLSREPQKFPAENIKEF